LQTPRISASSYSNTAPLIWSFLYGSQHGNVELILDNAPSRSAQLLAEDRVDAALVPVIMSQVLDDLRLIPDVCVGARERVRSVALISGGKDLRDIRSVSLDLSSRTSVILVKIIFREFLGFEPEWKDAAPNLDAMLAESDAALLIGDPALRIAERGTRNAESVGPSSEVITTPRSSGGHLTDSEFRVPHSAFKKFDLVELWQEHTGLGFVFAMWMTRHDASPLNFAAARDEGVGHLDEIVTNYEPEIGIGRDEMLSYLSRNISYAVDDSMRAGMELYFKLAAKCGLTEAVRPISFLRE
jgi:chorismate dehydratase